MTFSNQPKGREQSIIDLFMVTFTDSEGAEEGRLIGNLVNNLLDDTAQEDIHVFTAEDNEELIGAAIFTRLTYVNDPRKVFILSPMAVATEHQGQGTGQALLVNSQAKLREFGVDVSITYGDPAFYGKVGYMPLSETMAPPPLPLSQPQGWIGRSLTDAILMPIQGPSNCVEALNDPALW
ncbi:MAG: GNAT family N-acetyltransferase [Hyphomicrobiales bacterium]